jgi:protein-histidine pros-kinase
MPGSDARVEHRVRHADGSYRDAETILTNLLDEPSIAALVLNTRDVTDRKQVEEQLREQNIELGRASRAKDMFLATMSHELRTPLNAIIGFTGVLLMELPGPLNSDQARQLRTVEQSGRHLLAIINDILDMTKIESGTVHVELEQVDCLTAVDDVVSTLAPLATEKGLTLVTTHSGAQFLARADARALGQVLMNLVGNAVKFTDSGSVAISLSGTASAISITVADTGSGIAETDLRTIFQAFEQGTSVSQSRKEGTGLGLYVSHKLAELMGASLSVASVLGAGTTFTLTLEAWA